jgi:hypothetical protein
MTELSLEAILTLILQVLFIDMINIVYTQSDIE